jgi:hypothetical protein
VSDLVAFIKARLAEDEAVADSGEHWQRLHVLPGGTRMIAPEGSMTAVGSLEPVSALHVVRHDPARVLREVEAKRRIVEAYNEANEGKYAGLTYEQGRLDSLELALRLLALPYADHPSYDESWRP